MLSACKIGTPELINVPSVLANRAIDTFSTTGPTIGKNRASLSKTNRPYLLLPKNDNVKKKANPPVAVPNALVFTVSLIPKTNSVKG